jgi:hypothetical protein
MHRSLLPAIALLAACAPQNAAIVQGDFTAWLAATNSLTVARGDALFGDDGAVLLDEGDEGEASSKGYRTYTAIDCRPFETAETDAERDALRLPGHQKICEGDPKARFPLEQETWLNQNGFHVVSDALEPWRGEGIVTSEGDLQIGFHHRLPNGEDFRFEFVVDPDFAPQQCVPDNDGSGSHWEPVDGDWVAHWSKGLPEGSRRYMLNASAYQWDPGDVEPGDERRRWYLPLDWRAGYAYGKFADDKFSVRSTRYAEPWAYIAAGIDQAGVVTIDSDVLFNCPSGGRDACMKRMETRVDGIADDVLRELKIGGFVDAGDISVRPVLQDNGWRDDDAGLGGLDGWMGLDYSWVTFDAGSELEVGGSASGEFNLFLDAVDSQSRFHIRGHFTVDPIKQDVWVSDNLEEEQILPDSRPACGEAPAAEE